MNIPDNDQLIGAAHRPPRPKAWDDVTDDDIIAAVRFAAERDRDSIARGTGDVLSALSAPTPEQWSTQPPPPNALFGLGLIPPHGSGSGSASKLSPRLRRLAREGRIEEVPMVAPRGKPTSPGYRPAEAGR